MNTRPNCDISIRQWLFLLVVACVLPAAIAAAILLFHSYERETVIVEHTSIDTARALTQAVDRELHSAQTALQALATSPDIRSGNLAAFYRQTRQALGYRSADSVVLVDRTGAELLHSARPYGMHLPRFGNPALLEEMFRKGEPVISNLYADALTHQLTYSVAVPVMRGKQVVYALSMQLRPDRLGDILKQQKLPAEWPVAIFDGAGVTVARTLEQEKFFGHKAVPEVLKRMAEVREGSVDAVTLEGIPAMVVFNRSSMSNWAVGIGIPKIWLARHLLDSISWLIAGSLLLLLIGLAFARFIGRRITHSVRGLVGPAIALGAGRELNIPGMHIQEAEEVAQALLKAEQFLKKRTVERDQAEQAEHQVRAVQQQLEQSEALQRSIFEDAPDAILLVSDLGRVVRANREAARMFGYSQEIFAAMDVETLMPEAARHRHVSYRKAFFAAPSRRSMGSGMSLSGLRADGSEFPIDVMLSPLSFPSGNVVIATVRDITERLRSEEALRESEKRFRNTLEHAPIGMSIVGIDGHWIDVNNAMCELVGYGKEELRHMHIQDITYPEDLAGDLEDVRQLLDGTIRVSQLEKRYIRKDGQPVFVRLTRTLLHDDAGKPAYFITQVEDITARKAAEEQLTRLSNRLRLATQAAHIGVWEMDLASGEVWWDERMFELYRLQPGPFHLTREKWWELIHPEHAQAVRKELEAAAESGEMVATEFAIVWPAGELRTIRLNAVVTRDSSGAPLRMTGINWDVTESRRREKELDAALLEKETLLKELYHRVKNNLQVIASLFNLQLASLPEGVAHMALTDAVGRVRTMALVHEKLYQSRNLSSVALDDYIVGLCEQISGVAAAAERGIHVLPRVESVEAGLEVAVPLGLLLNELIWNSLRHAFPDGRNGAVTVSLKRLGNSLDLTVADDGIGFPPEFDPTSLSSLGLKLVTALSRQLDGKLTFKNAAGAVVELVMPLKPNAASQNRNAAKFAA